MTSAPTRTPRGTTPPNVIPFAKPRTIANLAAGNPNNVVMRAVTEVTENPFASNDFADEGPTTVNSPAQVARIVATSRPMASAAPVASRPPAHPVSGRTPPLAVHGSAALAVTAFPVAAQTIAPAAVPQIPASAPTIAMQAQPIAAQPATPAAQPAAEQAHQPWAVYEKLGLGAPKVNMQAAQKLVVSAYRLLGFVILSIIVVVLVGYIITTAFFYFSNTWIAPAALSPTDEKVVALQAQLVEQQNSRDRIADELNQAERSINAQQQFQLEFGKAIKSDLESRKATLGKIRALANAASSTRAAIKSSNSSFASTSRKKMQQEFAAGLIDRNTMAQGNFQLAQITSSNLTLAERQAEFETRAADLEAQTRSLDALMAQNPDEQTALSYEVLRIKQEYEASKLDLAKAVEARDTLKAALERQDKIVESLKQSAYLRAVNDGVHIAYVPYGNLTESQKGEKLYACKVGMVLCYKVGEVVEVLPGEVQFKHPQRDKIMRGQLVELKLDEEDADAAADDVLFVGGKPLMF